MSFPAYPSYRQSEVGWLGAVPQDWSIRRFRYVFRESAEKIEAEVVGPMLSVSGYRGIEVKEYDDENRRRLDEELVGYRIVRRGQLVVNTMWLNYAGLGVSNYEGHVSPAYRCYWISPDVDGRFIHYLMRSSIYVQGYTRLLTGIRPNSLQMSRDDLMDFPIILPPKIDQVSIGAFLDRETAKIDALVEQQRRLIELLNEERQVIIFEAVTKGLRPAAPKKETRIQWLGEVPKHWSVRRLSHCFDLIGSGTTPPAEVGAYYDGDFPWVTTGELRERAIAGTTKTVTEEALSTFSTLLLYPRGTLLMAMYGATIGRLGWLDTEACTNQACCAMAYPVGVLPRYIFYCLLAARNALILLASGGGQPNINQEKIRAFRVPVPPLDEQADIVAYVDRRAAGLEDLMEQASTAIAILQERRAALISSAVTGKIDVRATADQQAEAA